METAPHMQALRERAFAARKTLVELSQEAGVASAAFSRKRVSVKTLRALEQAMDAIEAERRA